MVRSMRSATCGTKVPSTTSVIAPTANTTSRRLNPSTRQPDHSSTSAYTIHAARAPASSTTVPIASAATHQPATPKRLRGVIQAERRQAGEHRPELEIARPEDAAEAVEREHRFVRAHAVAADRLLGRIDGEEQRARAGDRLQQRVQRPDADDDRQATEGDATAARIGDRRRDEPQERQIAQVDRAPRAARAPDPPHRTPTPLRATSTRRTTRWSAPTRARSAAARRRGSVRRAA